MCIDFEEIFDDFDFSKFDPDDEYIDVLRDKCLEYFDAIDEGASKFVMIKDDIVYKMPFKSCDGYEFESITDYCENEASNYCEAEENDVAEFFAKTEFYETVCGIDIYIQPKVISFSDKYNSDELRTWRTTHEERINYLSSSVVSNDMPFKWLDDAILLYGEEKVNQLCQFLLDIGINDCCARNVGYTLDSKPVIFDYAGFYD